MRILIVSQYYYPENAKIPTGLAEQLVAKGHEVRVITGYPNYPHGKIFEGYKQKLRFVETLNGVTVRRVPLFISHSQNAVGRIVNYLSFGFSALGAYRFARRAEVVYVYATQMTAAIGPSWWKRIHGLPYVLHVQDLWPESVTSSSMVTNRVFQRVLHSLLSWWLNKVYRSSSGVIAIAPKMKSMLANRGAEESKIHVVLNWADERMVNVRNVPDRAVGLTVTYAGTLGHFQNLDIAIEAAGMVQDLPGFRLLIVGSGVAETSLRALGGRNPNVEFRGRVPIEQMGGVYDESDFLLVSLKDLPIFSGTIPSKLQGSFAAGVPVIAAVAGDTTEMVENSGAGLTCVPSDAESLARVFRKAHSLGAGEKEAMGRRAQAFYKERMSILRGVQEIEAVLLDAALDG